MEMWRLPDVLVRELTFPGVLPVNSLGQQFALTEIHYVLFRLAREFSAIDAADPEVPWAGKIGLTVSSLHGAKVRLTPA